MPVDRRGERPARVHRMAGARCGGSSFNGLVRRRRRRMMADVHEYSSGLLRQRPTNASASTPTGHSLHERASSNNYAKPLPNRFL
jgi:hypothetical protein